MLTQLTRAEAAFEETCKGKGKGKGRAKAKAKAKANLSGMATDAGTSDATAPCASLSVRFQYLPRLRVITTAVEHSEMPSSWSGAGGGAALVRP